MSVFWGDVDCTEIIGIGQCWHKTPGFLNVPIFLVLRGVHLKRFVYSEIVKRVEKMIMAWRPIFFLSSCSGSEAQLRKVTTSFAI